MQCLCALAPLSAPVANRVSATAQTACCYLLTALQPDAAQSSDARSRCYYKMAHRYLYTLGQLCRYGADIIDEHVSARGVRGGGWVGGVSACSPSASNQVVFRILGAAPQVRRIVALPFAHAALSGHVVRLCLEVPLLERVPAGHGVRELGGR